MPAQEQVVRVNLADSPYNIHVKPGLLAEVGERVATLTPARRAMLMTDSNVGPRFGSVVCASCSAAGIEIVAECVIPAGENHKTFDQVQRAYDVFLNAKIERSTPILALGGGVIGDMAGFVAATILRGVPFIQIPTTLLSMVDASVGGKTGVNHAAGKNLIGAFHQPIAVLADTEVLKELPKRELVSGLAECIKHEIIRDADGFTALEANIDRALQLDVAMLTDLVAHNVRIKATVVEADPFEHADRAHLNFGHTFGHAVEKVSKFAYSHGESVALGMVAAAGLAVDLGLLNTAATNRIVSLISRAGLPTSGLTLDPETVYAAMAFDKKVKSSRIRFILPDQIGHVVVRNDVPPEMVLRAIQRLR